LLAKLKLKLKNKSKRKSHCPWPAGHKWPRALLPGCAAFQLRLY